MMMLVSLSTTMVLMSMLMMAVFFFSSSTESSNISKGSPFECGFAPLTSSSVSFSVPFFMVSIMFLIFDVEIIILCFFPLSGTINMMSSVYFWVILTTIMLATIYEWMKGLLEWD